jgi:MFS transporter, FHS family, glucose/mannose:H+ symporter
VDPLVTAYIPSRITIILHLARTLVAREFAGGQAFRQNAISMRAIQTRPVSLPISSAASVVLHGGFVVTGIATTLIGPILPVLISRWSLSDQRAGLFFTSQFCGSMLGVASIGVLIKRGYRQTFVCGFSLIAAGVTGLNLGSNVASLAATAVFGCGLGQVLSATNLWVAEVAKDRRVAALSILNLMWGIGAIASSPSVMLAQSRRATSWLLYAIATGAASTALILAGMNLEPATTEEGDEEQPGPARRENISTRSTVSLAALFFLYVGSENSVAGWVASLTKRMNPGSGDLWALAPMFFWGGLLAGRAVVPLVPLRRRERTLLASGLMLAAAGICLLLQARTFAIVAICASAAGLGLAAIYPILIAWLVKAFGESSRRVGAIMFALAGFGGATMPWLVGLMSTRTGSLRAGLLVPLIGCVAMFALIATMIEPIFRGTRKAG